MKACPMSDKCVVEEEYQEEKRIITSPSPVAPHAPTSSSAYPAAPTIGPSPILQTRNNQLSSSLFTVTNS